MALAAVVLTAMLSQYTLVGHEQCPAPSVLWLASLILGPHHAMHEASKQPHSQAGQLGQLANGGWNCPTQLVVVQIPAASA